MIHRIGCLLFTVLVLVSNTVAGTGFTTQSVTDWPRPYQHYSDNIVQYWPKVASNGDSFLVTWYEQYEEAEGTINTPAYAARYSSTGHLLDQDAICVSPDTYSYHIAQEPAVCAVGDDYWALYGSYGVAEYIYAKAISPDGSVSNQIAVGEGVGAATITSLAAASISDGNILATWFNAGDQSIGYSVLTPSGEKVVDSQILIRDLAFADHLAVAASGSTFLITFYVRSATSDPNTLCAMRVDAQGAILDQQPIVIASNCPEPAFDVIPYQGGWLAAYYSWQAEQVGGETIYGNVLRGRGIASDGTVADELFVVRDPIQPHTGDATIGIRQTPEGYLLSWSVYNWFLRDTIGIVQYGTIYNLDQSFTVLSQDTIPSPCLGSQLSLASNNAGTSLAFWSAGEDWIWGNRLPAQYFTVRTLRGGIYDSGPSIDFASGALTFAAVNGGANPLPQSVAISTASTLGQVDWSVSTEAQWLTLQPATGSTTGDAETVTVSVDSSGLLPGTYQTAITLTDPATNNSPTDLPVTLIVYPPAVAVPFFDDFSQDRAWTGFATDEWERGPAIAGGGDPGTDHTPTSDNGVLGYHIGGSHGFAYPRYRTMTSPPIDCAELDHVRLSFWRYLGVGAYASAAVQVSTDGMTWEDVWRYDEPSGMQDTSWTKCEYDISNLAAREPMVVIRFVMGLPDPSAWPSVRGGWSIDDLLVCRPLETVALAASPVGSTLAGRPITLTATPAGGINVEYRFFKVHNGVSTTIQPYTLNDNTCQITPTELGQYQFIVWAREQGSATKYVSSVVHKVNPPLSGVTIAATPLWPQVPGTEITVKATPVNGGQVEYRFYKADPGGALTIVQQYSTANTYTFTPSVQGQYQFLVYAREVGSGVTKQAYATMTYNVATPITSVNLVADPASPQTAGTPIHLTAQAQGGYSVQYRFFVITPAGQTVTLKHYAVGDNVCDYTPATPGRYTFIVWVRETHSTRGKDAYKALTFTVQ